MSRSADSVDPDGLARPEFLPDPSLSRDAMAATQRELAAAATFTDDLTFSPADVAISDPVDCVDGLPDPVLDGHDTHATSDTAGSGDDPDTRDTVDDDPFDPPVVVGVDQAFLSEREEAISAAVAFRGGTVVEYAHAVTELSIPYIPGLLAFREGGPILAALDSLMVTPDLLVLDGSGRIHYREAGIATHVGVVHDLPSVGVAKRLLCGTPKESVEGRPAGWRSAIRPDGSVETVGDHDDTGSTIGYAFQSKQYPDSRRVNPLYVSPGHRVSPSTAVSLVEALCAGYKLPEPTRLADAYADVVKRDRM